MRCEGCPDRRDCVDYARRYGIRPCEVYGHGGRYDHVPPDDEDE